MNVYDYYITPEEYDIALKNGISRDLVNKRIRAYGWTKNKAITIVPQTIKKYSDEIIELAKSNRISMNTFYVRVKNGWTQERAATEPINSRENILSKMLIMKKIKHEVSI